MREFRSELPSLIHKRGVDIDPVTIEVGDYILTPEICVERKSISDLIGSLQNGRLFNQATSMTRFYAKPMLLIEFDQNKPFALQGKYYLSKDIASTDITARLQLLTIHFPRLRILWSPSPHATAELFEELKKGREQPDAQKAAAMSFDFVDDFNADKFNANIKDILLKLPGITSKNVYAILNKVGGLVDLMGFSAEELGDILGSSGNGKELYDGLHIKAEALDAGDTKKRKAADVAGGANKKSRFKSKKK
jgi:DNA excision repair protein ERCC-4